MRALLVDDERLARARLRKLLEPHADVTIVGEADSVATARTAITEHAPDVIFLDITMPGGSGFDLLARERIAAHVVFVTAYDQHAIKAFDVGALDYLLKPINIDRLAATLDRLRSRTQIVERVALPVAGAVQIVAASMIVLVHADGDYTTVHLRDGATSQHKESLAAWEERLATGFVRISRDTLVSIADIERIERAPDASTYQIVVRNHGIHPVSRSRGAAVKALLLR